MPRSSYDSPQHASAHSLATRDHASPGSRASGDVGNAAGGAWRDGESPALAILLAGTGLCVLVFVLGVVAKLGLVSSLDLRIDRHIATYDRTSSLTGLAKFATEIATPETVGLGLLFLVPLILLLLRRRLDAVKALCVFGGAYALAEAGKVVIGEHRPPVSLQAMAADSSQSFPSGHATTAATLAAVLVVIVATTLAWRVVALVVGGIYALVVAASRVYLGDHFPPDVIGGILCALAAAFVVSGLFSLPVVQPYLRRFRLLSPAQSPSAGYAPRSDQPRPQ